MNTDVRHTQPLFSTLVLSLWKINEYKGQNLNAITSFLSALWKFTRPHTVIGTVVSLTSLFVISASYGGWQWVPFALSLAAAIGCNIFITGINQIYDRELDKINKPELPLASGKLNLFGAWTITILSLLLMGFCGYLAGWYILSLLTFVAILGFAYSHPAIRLKKHHVYAAMLISLVRGVVVNVGVFLFFMFLSTGKYTFPPDIIPLVWIITVFSVGIAWFKDLPDEKGDREHNLKTLAVISGRRLAFRNGVILVVVAFTLSIGMAFIFFESTARTIALISFFAFLLVFAAIASKVNVHDQDSLKQFYRHYWILFFTVYIIYPLFIWF